MDLSRIADKALDHNDLLLHQVVFYMRHDQVCSSRIHGIHLNQMNDQLFTFDRKMDPVVTWHGKDVKVYNTKEDLLKSL